MKLSVVFHNRDFSERVQPPQKISVQRYSWSMIGGPKAAYLTCPVTSDAWDLMKLLRCPVEIWGGDGHLNWWGFVNKVTIPRGEIRVGLGLDEFANYVIVNYSGGTTSAASDAQSISEFGQKEYVKNNTNATQTEGEADRDLYLSQRQQPPSEIDLSGGHDEVYIECYGWYQTLGWKYYTNAGTDSVSNTTQISEIVTSAGQFISDTLIENAAGVSSNEAQDGNSTAIVIVNKLLHAGTSNARPLLARVDEKRYLHVYERAAEPPGGSADYLLKEDGSLVTPLGARVPAAHCINAAWVEVRDVPNWLSSYSAMRPFFIDTTDYDAIRDVATYRPAAAYDQVRLARYIQDVISTGGGGSYGSFDIGQSGVGGVVVPTPTSATIYGLYMYASGSTTQSESNGVSVDTSALLTSFIITMTPSVGGLYSVILKGAVTNVINSGAVSGINVTIGGVTFGNGWQDSGSAAPYGGGEKTYSGLIRVSAGAAMAAQVIPNGPSYTLGSMEMSITKVAD